MNDVFHFIEQERTRQATTINLIASENYVSSAVLRASGSILTNKYAEGYPGKRYYAGCSLIDMIENEAIETAKKLFNADHANVQPHSGASANFAVYLGLLKPGDTILGMSLASGGHLTHGYKINFSGMFYNIIQYGVDPQTEMIDYDVVKNLAHQHKPKLIVAGASAYARLMDYSRFAAIAKEVEALLLVDMAHIAGLVAANVIPSPIPWADIVSSTTHKTLRGPRGGLILSKAQYAPLIDKATFPGGQGGPLEHIIAAKTIAFQEALQPSFKTYAQQIIANATVMAQTFKDLGYRIVANGTDTHLFMVDLRSTPHTNGSLTGHEVETLLDSCAITLNRNTIPNDPQPPTKASGLRIGTPAITTRGATTADVQSITEWIHDIIQHRNNQTKLNEIKQKAIQWCAQHPLNTDGGRP